ncbi:hypothetical protein ACMFMG_001899 [Clarireedia jacksonii]
MERTGMPSRTLVYSCSPQHAAWASLKGPKKSQKQPINAVVEPIMIERIAEEINIDGSTGASIAQDVLAWFRIFVQEQERNNGALEAAILQLRENDTPSSIPAQTTPLAPATPSVQPVVTADPTTITMKLRYSIAYPDKFFGNDDLGFPTFKGNLLAKLRINSAAIGNNKEQV